MALSASPLQERRSSPLREKAVHQTGAAPRTRRHPIASIVIFLAALVGLISSILTKTS